MLSSTAILLYLSRKYNTPDHWYPSDIQKRARVDEYLSWHHANIRANAPKTMWIKVRRLNVKMAIKWCFPVRKLSILTAPIQRHFVKMKQQTWAIPSWKELLERELFQTKQHQDLAKAGLAILVFPIKKVWYRRSQCQQTMPGFVSEYVTDLGLLLRASPSLHSCAECAHRQSLALVNMCFVTGSRKTCILHTSPCSLLRVEMQKEPSASSTLMCFSEIGSGTERRETLRGRFSLFSVVKPIYIQAKITWFILSQKII